MDFSALILLTLFSCTVLGDKGELRQIHVLFRHGERSPTETYPSDPYINYTWPGGWGQLSKTGKSQMYNLGNKLANIYKDFLPQYYFPADVNFTSSYADRCLMSAQLVAAGMFPPRGEQIWNENLLWQPIPIHYLPRYLDNTIAMKAECPKYDEMRKQVLSSTKVKDLIEENRNVFDLLSANCGMEVKTLETVEFIYNTLEIEKLNGLELPSWVNDTLMEEMKYLGAQNLALYSETEYMKRMKGGNLLKLMLTSMESFLNGRKQPQVNMYSGHDITIVHFVRALGLYDLLKPDFGAAVILELYSNSVVKIKYSIAWNKAPFERELATCKSPCTLPSLKEALKSIIPVNWEDECKL